MVLVHDAVSSPEARSARIQFPTTPTNLSKVNYVTPAFLKSHRDFRTPRLEREVVSILQVSKPPVEHSRELTPCFPGPMLNEIGWAGVSNPWSVSARTKTLGPATTTNDILCCWRLCMDPILGVPCSVPI